MNPFLSFILGFFSTIVLCVVVIVVWALWEKRQERLDQEYAESFQAGKKTRRDG